MTLATYTARALLLTRRKGGAAYDALMALSPARRRAARAAMARRREASQALDALSHDPALCAGAPTRFKRVLVDGMWDNPNYFTRYAMLRAALGLAGAEETGLLGRYRRREASASFDLFGIGKRLSFYGKFHPAHFRDRKSVV